MPASASVQAPARLREIEILRGIAIAAVIMIHEAWDYAMAAGLARPAGKAAIALHLTSCFAVPLFLMLTAVGLSQGYPSYMSAREYIEFLRRRALRLLPAFVFWSLVSLVVFKPYAFASVSNVVRNVLHGQADAQFYYIPLTFEVYLLWPVLLLFAHASARSAIGAMVVALSGVVISAWWWEFMAWKPPYQGTKFLILVYLLYVLWGIAAAPYLASMKSLASRTAVVRAACVLTAVTAWARYDLFITNATPAGFKPPGVYWASILFTPRSTAFIFCTAATAALLVFRYTDSLARVFLPLGRRAFGVFLVHYLVLRLVVYQVVAPAALASASITYVLATVVVGWLACIVLSMTVVDTMARFRLTRPLVDHRW